MQKKIEPISQQLFVSSIKNECFKSGDNRYGLFENLGEIEFIKNEFGALEFNCKVYYGKDFSLIREMGCLARPAFKFLNVIKSFYFVFLVVILKIAGKTIVYGTDRFWALLGEFLSSFFHKNKKSFFIYRGMLLSGNIEDIESRRNHFLSRRLKRTNYFCTFVGSPTNIELVGTTYVRSIQLERIRYLKLEEISKIVVLGEAWWVNGLPEHQITYNSEIKSRISKLKSLFPNSEIVYKPHPRSYEEDVDLLCVKLISNFDLDFNQDWVIAGSISTLLIEAAEKNNPIILFPSSIPVVSKFQEALFLKMPEHYHPFSATVKEVYSKVFND